MGSNLSSGESLVICRSANNNAVAGLKRSKNVGIGGLATSLATSFATSFATGLAASLTAYFTLGRKNESCGILSAGSDLALVVNTGKAYSAVRTVSTCKECVGLAFDLAVYFKSSEICVVSPSGSSGLAKSEVTSCVNVASSVGALR